MHMLLRSLEAYPCATFPLQSSQRRLAAFNYQTTVMPSLRCPLMVRLPVWRSPATRAFSLPEAGFTIEAWCNRARPNIRTPLGFGPVHLHYGRMKKAPVTSRTHRKTRPVPMEQTAGWTANCTMLQAPTPTEAPTSIWMAERSPSITIHNWAPPNVGFYIGCWATKAVHHHGLIDEVRLSNTVRYTDDFLLLIHRLA